MSGKPRHHTFGHEFYPEVALKAIALLCAPSPSLRPLPQTTGSAARFDRDELREAISDLLPQTSPVTRRAVANKIIQRFLLDDRMGVASTGDEQIGRTIGATPFVRLINGLRNRHSRLQLLYWQLSRVDTLVGALCRHVFYPYLILGKTPGEWNPAEFHIVNGGQLFAVDRFITSPFIAEFAKREWGFTSRATLSRSLRILLQCHRIRSRHLEDVRNHPRVYLFSSEPVQLAAFIFGVYAEWLPTHATRRIPMKSLENSRFARTLLISPAEVRDLIRRGSRYHFFEMPDGDGRQSTRGDRDGVTGTKQREAKVVSLTSSNLDVLVDRILDVAV